MLKIQLENSEVAEAVITKLRFMLSSDQPFSVFEIDPDKADELARLLDASGLKRFFVSGQNSYDEPFYSLFILEQSDEIPAAVSDYQLEKSFNFRSMSEAAKIWPHETLSDRIVDVVLAAASGYQTPRTIGFYQPQS